MNRPALRLLSLLTVRRLRLLVQWSVLALCLALGVRFAQFVRHYESFGPGPAAARPPGVEGFLPIGALVSLKAWLADGLIDPVHPAALVLLLTFAAIALLAKNAFCSWLCPVGTLSDALWSLRLKVWRRSWTLPPWADRPLRGLKYLLLLFFVKLILIDMPAVAAREFLASPYWAVADVRMLHFFTRPTPTALGVLAALVVLSALLRNAWCRYLCPYGALLGLLSLLSPLKVRRHAASCTDCRRCTAGCPARIAVHQRQSVRSVECNACLTCTERCPSPETLVLALPGRHHLPGRAFALLVVGLFAAGILAGILTGHWHSALGDADYRYLIPRAGRLGH